MTTRELNIAAATPFGEPLRRRFLPAFISLIEEFADSDLLSAAFGFSSRCGNQGGFDTEAVSRGISQRLGRYGWPIEAPTELSDYEVISLVEYFADKVALPDWEICSFCETQHLSNAEFVAGAQLFSDRVNTMFANFEQSYRIRDGKVVHERSPVLQSVLTSEKLVTSDEQLNKLIEAAINDFSDSREDRKLSALYSIVGAFERVKSLLDDDKKKSAEALVHEMLPQSDLAEPLEELFKRLTRTGNQYSIRHHEKGQKPLTDQALIEFLYYSFFNLVRFAVSRLPPINGAG